MLLACGEKIKSETQNLHEPSWWEVTGLGIIPSWNPVSLTVGLSSDVKQSFKLFSLFFFLCLQWSWNTDNKLALHSRLLVAHPQSPGESQLAFTSHLQHRLFSSVCVTWQNFVSVCVFAELYLFMPCKNSASCRFKVNKPNNKQLWLQI